jgi:hypothetical protein
MTSSVKSEWSDLWEEEEKYTVSCSLALRPNARAMYWLHNLPAAEFEPCWPHLQEPYPISSPPHPSSGRKTFVTELMGFRIRGR